MENPDIKVGDATFLKDGGTAIGAVHRLSPEGRPEFVIYIENAGDFVIPFSAIKTVHFDKIILDAEKLDGKLRATIAHEHDNEIAD